MTALITVVSFLVIIIVLTLAHELGHFVTAKISGIRVEEFAFGFPPRLFSVKRGETEYSINAIPLGGYVKMAGEEDPNIPSSLASKSIPTRILVLSSGSLMNLLLPLVLFSIAFMVPHDVINEPVIIREVVLNSPAEMAGIRPGDTILSTNGRPVDSRYDLSRAIQLYLGKEMSILVQHDDMTTELVQVTPRWQPPEGEGAVGIAFDVETALANRTITSEHEPFWRAIPTGVRTCIETMVLFKNGILSMFAGTEQLTLTGPVGIAQLTGEIARAGMSPLLEFAAFLSINFAIINIFPLPALDGGRIAFVLLEWVRRGKRIQPKTEGLIHLIGFALLMAFFVAITFQDIVRIISGESLIP